MEIEMVEASGKEPIECRPLEGMADGTKERSKKLYLMLVMSVQGKALLLCKASERNNGYEAWSRLKAEYEPKAGARRTGMLAATME
eukprot:1790766-Amphidinium_carterae.7